MTDIPRRTLAELAARYTFEPSLDDIFVEGSFDREVLAAAFLDTSSAGRAIYEIATVEVSAEMLVAHGMTEGNKQRVIVLARELSKLAGKPAYVCVVDRDLDHWLGDLEVTARLRWSTYCAMELNFFSEKMLRDLLVVTCKAKIENLAIFFLSFRSFLAQMYVMRLASESLGWKMTFHSAEKCLSLNGNEISFDKRTYVARLLQLNGQSRSVAEFNGCVENWEGRMHGDHRMYIRGHDFVDALSWVIKASKGLREMAPVSVVERLLVMLARGKEEIRAEVVLP